MRRLRSAIALATTALVLAACGGSSHTNPPAPAHGRAGQDPKALVRAMAKALRRVRSYHFVGRIDGADGPARVTGDIASDGSVRLHEAVIGGADTIDVIVGQPNLYLRASRAYWDHHSAIPVVGARLGGRWVSAPSSVAPTAVRLAQQMTGPRLAYCTTHPIGTVSHGGTTTVAGRRAIIIVDKGNAPGDAPGAFYLPARGRPLPLRIVDTYRVRRGGHRDSRCLRLGGPHDLSTQDIRLSRFNAPITIPAPPNPLILPR